MRQRLTMDDRASAALEGFLTGFTEVVSTHRYIDAVLNEVTSDLEYQFGIAMDAVARLHLKEFQHVYESGDEYMDPNYIGNSLHRLWVLTAKGSGGKREVGFVFKPSVRPVPVHPGLLKPNKKGRHVLPNVHVFTWKAPIMEYGLRVTIKPELSEKPMLAFWSEQYNKPLFTERTIRTVPGAFADGGGTIGNFTGFFLYWWGNEAPQHFAREIKPRLEQQMINDKDVAKGITSGRTQRKLTAVGTDRWYEFNRARSRAKAEWQGRMHNHLARAKQRRGDLYGD